MTLLACQLWLPLFALVLARVAGLAVAVPMFSSGQIPRMVKVLLVVAASLAVFPVVASELPSPPGLSRVLPGLVGELIIGEALGLAAGVVFFAAQMAGQIVSHQAGLALGQVFNPFFDEETTVLDQLWFFAAMLFFILLRGHLAVVDALLTSFRQVPPLMLDVDGRLGGFAVATAGAMFALALRLAGPAICALFLASVVLGFLARTMPQLNIYSVGFSVKIVLALGIVAVTLSASQTAVGDEIFAALDRFAAWMEGASKGVIDAR